MELGISTASPSASANVLQNALVPSSNKKPATNNERNVSADNIRPSFFLCLTFPFRNQQHSAFDFTLPQEANRFHFIKHPQWGIRWEFVPAICPYQFSVPETLYPRFGGKLTNSWSNSDCVMPRSHGLLLPPRTKLPKSISGRPKKTCIVAFRQSLAPSRKSWFGKAATGQRSKSLEIDGIRRQ